MKKIVFKIGILLLIFTTTAQAQLTPSYWWKCSNGNTSYNYNPAVVLNNNQNIALDSIPYFEEYTVIVVYHAMGESAEKQVWQLHFNDSIQNGLTTRNIHHGKTYIQYSADNRPGPIINTLQQSTSLEADSTQRYCRLVLGASDSIPTHIKVAEVMYFEGKPGMGLLRRVQSYLAIKYGVTLGPVNYNDGYGNIVWRYNDNKKYHNRITGVGVDSTYGLVQMKSASECDSSIITLYADSLMQGRFCLLGDNNGALEFIQDTLSSIEYLSRIWKVNQTLGSNVWDTTHYAIAVDTLLLPANCDSLVLMVNDEYYYPDSVADSKLYYSNIVFGNDSTFMALVRGNFLWDIAGAKTKQSSPSSADALANISTQVYPNPTNGHYTIDVNGANEVIIKIYNALGKEIQTYYDKEKTHYSFSGSLPNNNVYYVTITTEQGSQTTKLIVK